jgi:predicted peptidase
MKRVFLPFVFACLCFGISSYAWAQVATEPTQSNNPFTDPAPTPAPATTAPATSAAVMAPANPNPMLDFTKYFAQQAATISAADGTQAQLTYFMFAPVVPAAAGTKFPLILVLQDASGEAYAGRYLITETVRNAFPAYVMVPALPANYRWAEPGNPKPTHALSYAVQIIKQLTAMNPAIDSKRIYVIGCGPGGNGAYGAAQLYSDVFAAAVPIAASWNAREVSNMKNVPIAAFHGVNDVTVPLANSSDTIAMVQHDGGTAFFTRYENMAHDCSSDRIYNDLLWKWLFAQKKAP